MTVCIAIGAGCEDLTAPEAARAIATLEDRIAREWIADPGTFPEPESIWFVAQLAEAGTRAVPVTINIDGLAVPFRAIAYELANDPFVLGPEGPVRVWRRGLVVWRGTPAQEIIAIWARSPDSIARPSLIGDLSGQGSKIFEQPRAFRVRRDTARWQAVHGVVSVADPVSTGPCRFRTEGTSATARSAPSPVTCTSATFAASFDLVFERHDAKKDSASYHRMMVNGLPDVPFRGIKPTRISLPEVLLPGVRFVTACGTTHGAPNDSTCLSTDARPSP